MDNQRGQRLSLRCTNCKRPLGIFFIQKSVNKPAKLTILNGSVHKTNYGTIKIHAVCKCNTKTIFENNSEIISKNGWRRLN